MIGLIGTNPDGSKLLNRPEVNGIDLYVENTHNMIGKGNIFPLEVEGFYIWSSARDGERDYEAFYDWKVYGADGGIIASILMAKVTIPYEELVAVLEQNNQN